MLKPALEPQGSDPALLDRLAAIVGSPHVIADRDSMTDYLVEPRGKWPGSAHAIIRPGSTAEVSAVLRLCQETATAVVPQGGNTGLVGGQMPMDREIVLSLRRLDRVRAVEPMSNSIIVEAGVTLARVRDEAEAVDRMFPLSLASEGSCTIGGNLATNAGGTAVLAYGNARDLVLGLEVVLADGRVLRGLNTLRKDNTGYDLKHLFMGSEGTLGVITAAALKLWPRPLDEAAAFVGLRTPAEALDLLALAQKQAQVTSFELIPRIGIEFTTKHAGARDPLTEHHPWYVLLDAASSTVGGAAADIGNVLEEAFERDLIGDATVSASIDQRRAFWRLRESLSDVQRLEGGSIKHDIAVPLSAIPTFLAEADAAVERLIPGVRVVAFGHVGDGNLHYNLSQPLGADQASFLGRWEEVNAVVHGIVTRLGGSISAEHGIGQSKRDLLPEVKDPTALALMHTIKQALDPKGILNPGKVLQR
jgi:FAD/FMN-containing dehydrogenase